MKRTAFATLALALAATGPALASDQLARSLNLEPGAYSTAELVAIRGAREDRSVVRENDLLDRGTTTVVSSRQTMETAEPANAQLARSLGVEPGAYSLTELTLLKRARDSDDTFLERQVLDGRF